MSSFESCTPCLAHSASVANQLPTSTFGSLGGPKSCRLFLNRRRRNSSSTDSLGGAGAGLGVGVGVGVLVPVREPVLWATRVERRVGVMVTLVGEAGLDAGVVFFFSVCEDW